MVRQLQETVAEHRRLARERVQAALLHNQEAFLSLKHFGWKRDREDAKEVPFKKGHITEKARQLVNICVGSKGCGCVDRGNSSESSCKSSPTRPKTCEK